MRLRASRLTTVAQAGRLAAAPALSLVLDQMGATPAAAFSLRRLTADYVGPAVRVRRDSDNAELDVGFASTPDTDGHYRLNTDALLNFCGAPPRPGDFISGAAAVYSLRRWRADYNGPCLRVRRASDNAEQDIGFAAGSIHLDTAALSTFIGASTPYVCAWYDQSGNGCHASQAVAASQPQVVLVGTSSGRPTLYFDSDALSSLVPAVNDGSHECIALIRRMGGGAVNQQFGNSTGSGGFYFRNEGTANLLRWGHTGGGTATAATAGVDLNFTSMGLRYDGTTATLRFNGTDVSSAASSYTPAATHTFSMTLNGLAMLAEVVLFGTPISAADRANLERSQALYFAATYSGTQLSGYVTQWYDQHTTARHAVQATAASQPIIVTSGVLETVTGDKACISFTGARRLDFSGMSTSFACSAVGAPLNSASYRSIGTDAAHTQHFMLLQNHLDGNVSAFVGTFGASTGTWAPGEVATFYSDNTNVTSTSALGAKNGGVLINTGRDVTVAPAVVGNSSAGNRAFGDLCELVYLNTHDPADRAVLEASQGSAYGITIT